MSSDSKLKLDAPLSIDQIDFRIQSINKGGYATILAYKDARVDINRLNAVCGKYGWQRAHSRDNHNCTVSLWDKENKHWVSKEDTGTESNTEQQKGLASDSFKRACFNWGIGIELYDYPVIQVKLNDNEWGMKKGRDNKERPAATWELNLKEWIWFSSFEEGKLSYLTAVDHKGRARFTNGIKPNQISPEPINQDHVNYAFEQYKGLITADTEEVNYKKMQGINNRLTNDERMAVMDKFGNDTYSPDGKKKGRLFRTLIADYLKMTEADLQNPENFQ